MFDLHFLTILFGSSLFFLLFLFFLFRKRKKYPYFSREKLLTPAELKFFHVLQAVVKNKHLISCKVRLGDVIQCSDKNWKKGYGPKISAKHLDFVLFDSTTSTIILCIELDDKTHNLPHRQKRDVFVNEALKSANVPLLRIKAQKGYDLALLDKEIRNILT